MHRSGRSRRIRAEPFRQTPRWCVWFRHVLSRSSPRNLRTSRSPPVRARSSPSRQADLRCLTRGIRDPCSTSPIRSGFALGSAPAYEPVAFPYPTEPLLPTPNLYGIGADYNGILSAVACKMIPWRRAVQFALAHGEWPIHNPFILSGDILAAAAQP